MADLKNALRSKKILIVDDEPFMRTLLGSTIKHIGFKDISEAKDANSALTMLSSKPFDIIFCDWEMPGMTGLELFKQIKETEELKSVQFVMVTGHTQASLVKEAIECGVTQYIAKPFNEGVIRKKLVKLLSKKG